MEKSGSKCNTNVDEHAIGTQNAVGDMTNYAFLPGLCSCID